MERIDYTPNIQTTYNRRGLRAAVGVLVVSGLVVTACSPAEAKRKATASARSEQQVILDKRGISGQHELFDARTVTNRVDEGKIKGSMGGLLLFPFGGAEGSIDGEFKSQNVQTVILAWETNAQPRRIVPSEIALSKVQYQILANPHEKPRVQFEFDTAKMEQLSIYSCDSSCGVDKKLVDSPNPNDYLQNDSIQTAVISLSENQFKSIQGQTNSVHN